MADNQDLHLTTDTESPEHHPATAIQAARTWAVVALGVPAKTDFYTVWFAYILGGWKSLVSSTEPDGRYYEVTYNKQKNELYVDTYTKTHNHLFQRV